MSRSQKAGSNLGVRDPNIDEFLAGQLTQFNDAGETVLHEALMQTLKYDMTKNGKFLYEKCARKPVVILGA